MQDIRSILVVLDPQADEQPALQRACMIAGASGSELHLLDCGSRPGEQLEQLARELRNDGFTVVTRQQDGPVAHQQIIAVQQEEGCGLVIKQHYPENLLHRLLLTPDDWKLLRHCPCPVLLVRCRNQWKQQPVLAAVDLNTHDPQHQALHGRIVSHAIDLCRLIQGPLHVISIHPATPLSSSDPAFSLGQAIITEHQAACDRFRLDVGIDREQLHLCEGNPDSLIPRMAAQLDAAVTVIGSVARLGLDAALIGNTAESVLEAVEHDVLVLKPEPLEQQLARQFDQSQ